MYEFLVVVLAVLINGSFAKVAPSFINICPGLKADCLKKTIQEAIPFFTKGIPELGVIPTDPLRDDNVELDLPGAFKVHLNNGSLTGLRKCIVEDVSYENDVADLTLKCNATIKGKYKANGHILIVTIKGDGDAKIKAYNVIIGVKIVFKDVIRDGVTYYEISDYKINHKYGDKVSFVLTNLFEGNPQISEAVLLFLNQNWKQIVEEFGGPILDRLVKIVFSNVKTFFSAIPKSELIA